ncbi:MAG: MqnA/MqnD/SBP family protein [Thermomicrobiales bacterium]
MTILIERRLGTAPYWMPIERGWVDIDEEVRVVESPTTAELREHDGLMLVDTLLGSTVAGSSLIVADHAVAADSISLLTMVTSGRPDAIERVTVSAPGISLTGRAIAEIVIPEFYGIEIAGWSDEPADVSAETIVITEDEGALLPTSIETDYHEDLGRAWFLLTDTPFVSDICLAPEDAVQNDPDSVRASVAALDRMLSAANDQRRLLRRNISRDHDIDRDLVVDVFDGLKFELTAAGRNGVMTLFQRTGVAGRIGSIEDRFISLG